MMVDRVQAVRCASIKCLCEMIKHSTFLYSPPSSNSASSQATTAITMNNSVAHELDTNIKFGFKALDNSNYDVRCSISVYLAQLIFYSISQIQKKQQQLLTQQQLANAAAGLSALSGEGNSKQKQQAIQQQQNANALLMNNEKIKNTLMLLANGFSKLNTTSSSFNYVRGAASSLAASAGSKVSSSPMSAGGHAGINSSLDDSALSVSNSVYLLFIYCSNPLSNKFIW